MDDVFGYGLIHFWRKKPIWREKRAKSLRRVARFVIHFSAKPF